jgi:hypothetical protein
MLQFIDIKLNFKKWFSDLSAFQRSLFADINTVFPREVYGKDDSINQSFDHHLRVIDVADPYVYDTDPKTTLC